MGAQDHAADIGERIAELVNGNNYKIKGYDHIRATRSRCMVYSSKRKLKHIRRVLQVRGTGVKKPATDDLGRPVHPGSDKHAARYAFTYKDNFRNGGTPYTNQAHHMIPESAFSEEIFTSDQLKLMWMVPYKINDGDNIIFLPVDPKDSIFHLLPSHSGNHPQYTDLVVEDMSDVRNALQKVIAKDPDHKNWSPPNDIVDRLKEIQNDYWNYLSKCGPLKINDFKKPAVDRLRV